MTLYAFTKAKDTKAYSTDDYTTFNIKTYMKNANWADSVKFLKLQTQNQLRSLADT